MTEVTDASNSKPLDMDALVALFVELRDTKAAMAAKLKEDLKPYNQGLEELEVLLLKALQQQGAKSVRTPSGTVYQTVERSATTKDKKAFREFVLDKQEWDLLEWRPAKVAVFDYMEKQKVDVPGVNTSAAMTIGVRRGTSEQEDE